MSLASLCRSRFARFLLAGGFAAGVNFGSRIVLSLFLPYVPAIVAAYLLGMATAFALCKTCVFDACGSNRTGRELLGFALVNAAAVVQTVLVSVLLNDYGLPALGVASYRPEIAHAVGVVVPVFTSYIGHKRFSFGASSACGQSRHDDGQSTRSASTCN